MQYFTFVAHHVNGAWMNINQQMNLGLEGKIFKSVVKPAKLYWTETWLFKMAHMRKDWKW